MKKEKTIKLKDVNVKSFVTVLDTNAREVRGGWNTQYGKIGSCAI